MTSSYSLRPIQEDHQLQAFTIVVDAEDVGYIGLLFPNDDPGGEWLAMRVSDIRYDSIAANTAVKAGDADGFAAAVGIHSGFTKDEAIRYVLGAQSCRSN